MGRRAFLRRVPLGNDDVLGRLDHPFHVPASMRTGAALVKTGHVRSSAGQSGQKVVASQITADRCL